jgi:hypothetical protein
MKRILNVKQKLQNLKCRDTRQRPKAALDHKRTRSLQSSVLVLWSGYFVNDPPLAGELSCPQIDSHFHPPAKLNRDKLCILLLLLFAASQSIGSVPADFLFLKRIRPMLHGVIDSDMTISQLFLSPGVSSADC